MALFCPDAVVWGDVGTWVTALGALLIGFAGISLNIRASRAATERARREELGARVGARAALRHCWVWLAQAERAVTPEGKWQGSSHLCASIITTMDVDALERAAVAANVLEQRECEAIAEAAISTRAAQLLVGELVGGSYTTPWGLRTALERLASAVYHALEIVHDGAEDAAVCAARDQVTSFQESLQSVNGVTWIRGRGFVPAETDR